MRRSKTAYLVRVSGFLAIWNGFYMAGAYLVVTDLSGQSASGLAFGVAWLTGQGAYLLDRVKLSTRFADPADRQADPDRADFLERHALHLRIWVTVASVTAIIGAVLLQPLLVGPVAAAFAGAFLYGSSPRPRPKDIPAVKNLLVGVAIASLAAALAWAGTSSWPTTLLAASLLIPAVAVDAMLCDLPDRESDREHGTRTLADAMGRKRTRLVSMLVLVLSLIAATIAAPSLQRNVVWLFLGALLLTTPGIIGLRPRSIRDAIDFRLPLVATLIHLAVLMGIIS